MTLVHNFTADPINEECKALYECARKVWNESQLLSEPERKGYIASIYIINFEIGLRCGKQFTKVYDG